MTAVATTEHVLNSLAIPAGARVDQRVPKKLLVEQGAPTAGDRRQINDGIESLHWVAALKPTTIGVPVYRDDIREYLEISVLVATLRGSVTKNARASRLMELIHRAIPYPVLLLTESAAESETGAGTVMSLAHKRHAQNEAGKVVIEEMQRTDALDLGTQQHLDFLGTMPIASLPSQNLFALYQSWMDSILALQAAGITGAFELPASVNRSTDVREGLNNHNRISRELVSLRAQAVKENQISRRVELNLIIKRLEIDLAQSAASLKTTNIKG